METYNDRGCWIIEDGSTKEHAFDKSLCDAIIEFLQKQKCRSVVDLGCGLGDYVNEISKAGISAEGFDGNPYTAQLTGGRCQTLDLSVNADLRIYDWVVSLEVGEHIPKDYEQCFIDNVTKSAKRGVIISWAIEGQGGFGHVNCQNNEYIKTEFEKRGFINQSLDEQHLRNHASLEWFHNTIMIFTR